VDRKGAKRPIFEGETPPKKMYPQYWRRYRRHNRNPVKRRKPLVSINSEDDVQSELPVESAITVDVENTTCCDNIFDDESEVERSDILKSASLLILGGARRHSYQHPTNSDTNEQKITKRTK
jgi:hypothetical protein